MSAPAFAWAFEKGHELGLTSSQLVLLLYMADQANCREGDGFFTGQPRLAKYTRLTERTIRELIPQLAALGLIRVTATSGKPTTYRCGSYFRPGTSFLPGKWRITPGSHFRPTPATSSAPPRKFASATPEIDRSNPGSQFRRPLLYPRRLP
jgi:hypothetical protein